MVKNTPLRVRRRLAPSDDAYGEQGIIKQIRYKPDACQTGVATVAFLPGQVEVVNGMLPAVGEERRQLPHYAGEEHHR